MGQTHIYQVLIAVTFLSISCRPDGVSTEADDMNRQEQSGHIDIRNEGDDDGERRDYVSPEQNNPGPVAEPCERTAVDICVSPTKTRQCINGFWEETMCPSGLGCVAGTCLTGRCADFCTPEVDGSGACQFFDVTSHHWSTPDTESLHYKEQMHRARLRRDGLFFGGVGGLVYDDIGTYEDVGMAKGIGDAAMFTGLYVAAEALRYGETRAPDALNNMLEGLETLHLWWNVSGVPAALARFVQPDGATWRNHLGQAVDLEDITRKRARENDLGFHRDVLYEGQRYEFLGHVSRDQYQGVMLAFALAYDVLDSRHSHVKDRIRTDVVALIEQLMKETTIPAKLTLHFRPINLGITEVSEFSLDTDVTMPYIIDLPFEYEDGRAVIDLVVDNESERDKSTFYGMQEFMPNLQRVLDNVDLPSWLNWVRNVPLPRSGSAVILGSFFRVGMHMTEGEAAYREQYERFSEHFFQHVGPGVPGVSEGEMWLDVAALSPGFGGCTEAYYGHNITITPLYNWLRLENDPVVRVALEDAFVRFRFWPRYRTHKNSYFTYILASGIRPEPDTYVDEAQRQLELFPMPPRIREHVDIRDEPNYVTRADCDDESEHAIDIDRRPVKDFQWQRHPWDPYQDADLRRVSPGGDYMIAYWLGRAEGYIEEDLTGCYAFRDD